jgi:hypothetical protein
VGPITIFDKSALQALNMDEAVWFDAFFLANVVPVFYVETLADLEKEVAEGRTPEQVVGNLAEKTPSGAAPNVYHRPLILAELTGQAITMTGQVIVSAGDVRQAPDGAIGVHVDEFPEEAMLLRWRSHEFLEIERAAAKGWRAELAEHDPDQMVGLLKNIVPAGGKFSDLERLKGFTAEFCTSTDREVIELALDVVGVPGQYLGFALARWEADGRPPLDQFAPYTAHVFQVDLLFYLGIHFGFISGERASNRADMAYLYYLPFGMVFVSGDRLHHRTVPFFLRKNQSYVRADDLKQALREIDEHYYALPDEIKELGVLQFASYPPSDLDNIVTQLWDKHVRPDWRDIARRQEAERARPREKETDEAKVAEIRKRLEGAQHLTDLPVIGREGPEYFVIRRQVPVRKGKWRMVSKEVEEAQDQ